MEFEINAGVKVDLATPEEVRGIINGALAGWRAELARGTRFRHPGAPMIATAGGTIRDATLGPLEGFVWSVTRITISGLTAAQLINAYLNDVSTILALGTFAAAAPANTIIYGERGLILNGGDRLVFDGSGLSGGGVYAAALEVTELPVQLASRLL